MSQPNPIETFRLEAEDLLIQIEHTALDISARPADPDSVNQLFRAFHTLKGSGSMFGFDSVAGFTHHVENTLGKVRDGELEMTPHLVELILEAKDQIKGLLEGGSTSDCDRIVAALHSLVRPSEAACGPVAPLDSKAINTSSSESFRIHFRPQPSIAATGLDPASLLKELGSLGECTIVANTEGVPPLEQLQADNCYISWDIALSTTRGLNAIKDVFIFVEDDCELTIEPLIDYASPKRAAAKPTRANIREVKDSQPRKQTIATPAKPHAPQATVRVPSEKLDRLVNLVGELVMNQSRLIQVSDNIDSPDLAIPVEAIERLIAELRDNVLGIRMMPIASTFNRFRRLVHDLSHDLAKEIELVTEGEETELDKTVLDQLGDPLVHLIRNCIDHGLEPAEERAQAGKSSCGTIRLAAAHEGAQVIVSIEDDGRGLDTEALLAKAIEKGLVAPESNPTESEIFNLIFLPGFSTAKEVTNVSGRGVGMDAVKRQIEALRGGIKIASKRGEGTRISLTLPLTLAIIDGLMVEVDGDRFILPMSAVAENVELTSEERRSNNGRNLINVRGELVPYLRLRELFNLREPAPQIEKIVIASHEGQRIGFVVDKVLGSHQTVIQSLGRFYGDIRVVSGATIMGDGRVALIIDIAGIVRHDAARASTVSSINTRTASATDCVSPDRSPSLNELHDHGEN